MSNKRSMLKIDKYIEMQSKILYIINTLGKVLIE